MLRDWLTKLLCPQHIASPPGRDATIAAETADVAPINAFYYEVAMMKLQSQFQEIRAIDTRSTSYFTIGSAILPIVAGFLAADQGLIARPPLADLALALGFLFYVLLTIFYVWSFRYSGWDSRPDVQQWKLVSAQFKLEDLQGWLGDACVEAYTKNEPAIERKANKSAMALWSLGGEAIFLSAAVATPLWPFP
jgi:hypothetical protein